MDRYVKIVLTVIAVELFWIGVNGTAPPVSAQAQQGPTPVVIRGIEIGGLNPNFLPVAVVGSYRETPTTLRPLAAEITATAPLRIDALRPLKVEIDQPITISNEQPLLVENVGYTPTRQPR